MRVVSELLDADVAGSGSQDRIVAHAWRGGDLLHAFLPVTDFSLSWDTSRQVQGQGSLTVADPDGRLAPWGTEAGLAPFGSRLELLWISGTTGIEVPLGWTTITQPNTEEHWLLRRDAKRKPVVVPGGGGKVAVAFDELPKVIIDDRLDAENVPAGATCLGEVTRLLAHIMAVTIDPAIVDKNVPAGLVYEESRMDAVEDHLARVGAVHRMNGDGDMEIIPAAGIGPVWSIDGGNEGALIGVAQAVNADGVYNAVISRGQDAGGAQLVGRAYLLDGPLAWDGPLGRRPLFHQSIATTASGVQADANTLLANRAESGEVELDVECLMHPGLQPHDLVTVQVPTLDGLQTITGRVTKMTMSASGGVVSKRSKLGVAVTSDALDALRSAS